MLYFFGDPNSTLYVLQKAGELSEFDREKLQWLFNGMPLLNTTRIEGSFIGPRASMITPWSTNATEIMANMGIAQVKRIERFTLSQADQSFDPMLFQRYDGLDAQIFELNTTVATALSITDIDAYNRQEGLSLSEDEVAYLESLSAKLNRHLTDSEVFGFSQVNSEHCRHKIFNGIFEIDQKAMPESLFGLIRKTSATNPNGIVSAYKDNVAFIEGPEITQFAPKTPHRASYYCETVHQSVISLKAETHNFPTTVEPFNGAATGSGGEIRDRLAGGIGSIPLVGTAVYMTSYPRHKATQSTYESANGARDWLYQTPLDILIKASNGASDFGNKFGQPLIVGSLLTFEHQEKDPEYDTRILGYDKVIMLAGGVGYSKSEYAQKKQPKKGDKVIILGGDNYRIGMGGAAVSSADTGAFGSAIELNAIQRSNPEMQKRAANAIRALVESDDNPIISVHDHGAGGHLNCLSELVEETGGIINIDQLPLGDPTLSEKEIIGNESQERMGLVVPEDALSLLSELADRERAPLYEVGEITGDHRFSFYSEKRGSKPIDLALSDFFGSAPKMVLTDQTTPRSYAELQYSLEHFHHYLDQVLSLEAVACKDWLTNKVDRCVSGKVAKQQCIGPLQLPLQNYGIAALDFTSYNGIATSIGHSPISGLIDPEAASKNSIAEALTNIMWAPLNGGLKAVSLSANWMWPCNNEGENARLYRAVEAASRFAIDLGINIPTGKDSLSMKQQYADKEVIAPGTVIISAAAHCEDFTKAVEPLFKRAKGDVFYINLSKDSLKLGGSSFAQTLGQIGTEAPTVTDHRAFAETFNWVQGHIKEGHICAGHDIASGGLITSLLELCFADHHLGAQIDLSDFGEDDTIKLLFAENASIVFQATELGFERWAKACPLPCIRIGSVTDKEELSIKNKAVEIGLNVASLRDRWYETSVAFDQHQTAKNLAFERFENYKKQPLTYSFPPNYTSAPFKHEGMRPKAAILREKGSNSEREMANALYAAGFDVKDLHMTDLISGRETLEDVQFLGAVGGFSNSDVLGSAKGWAGAFKYNEKAQKALNDFFAREDTLSLGICNGCQLFMELELLYPEHAAHAKMTYNDSLKHESAFTSVTIEPNHSVMLGSLTGSKLGVWISHGEGKFKMPLSKDQYHIVGSYGYDQYPSNPNGSDYNTAMLADKSGRHLVTMPHIERSLFAWNWAYYPESTDHFSPWIEAFINAKNWILNC
ncbi:MAG: phosphoribosylformylglycinamidine synthase [Flavobacteriaceae bacterium]